MEFLRYNRKAAVAYAHRWAYDRNPRFYNYEEIGGDCTNFASQCLYAGTRVMNFTPTFGWYYRNANDKSPSWTGVSYFYNFLTEKEIRIGPFAIETDISSVLPGDFVQLATQRPDFHHTPVIVRINGSPSLRTIYVAAHSSDTDNRPLSSYSMHKLRFIHIEGVRLPV